MGFCSTFETKREDFPPAIPRTKLLMEYIKDKDLCIKECPLCNPPICPKCRGSKYVLEDTNKK